jgi:hypothetical protein
MNAIQTISQNFRPDAGAIGRTSIAFPSTGTSAISQLITKKLDDLAAPTPSFSGVRIAAKGLDEQLYDALAAFKIRTAAVAMHLDRGRRSKLFGQLDSLLALDDWEREDAPPTIDSYSTLLRMLMLLRPQRRPGLGASADGHLIATWTAGADRLTIECMSKDIVRWHLSATIDGERERAAAETPLLRLAAVLRPYGPERWFQNANHLPAA